MCCKRSRYHWNGNSDDARPASDLNAARSGKFVEFLVDLLGKARNDLDLLRSIKRAELAVNIADIGVINISIDYVGHDLGCRARRSLPPWPDSAAHLPIFSSSKGQ